MKKSAKRIRIKNTVSAKLELLLRGTKGDIRSSLGNLLKYGITNTGHSSYSRGRAIKSVWTNDVVAKCNEFGIKVERSNVAPRGGASGEKVSLVADRRKNKWVHKLHQILHRCHSIMIIRAARESREREIQYQKENAQMLLQAEQLKALVILNKEEIESTLLMEGEEKNKKQGGILRRLMLEAGMNPDNNPYFWGVWKLCTKYLREVNEQNVIASIASQVEEAKQNGEPILTKEYFNKATGACFVGIDAFLKQNFGTSSIEEIPLNVVLPIIPTTYRKRLNI